MKNGRIFQGVYDKKYTSLKKIVENEISFEVIVFIF